MKNMATQRLHEEVSTLEIKSNSLNKIIIPDIDVVMFHLDSIKKWISRQRFKIVITLQGISYDFLS